MFVALEMLAVAVDSRLVGSDLKPKGALPCRAEKVPFHSLKPSAVLRRAVNWRDIVPQRRRVSRR